MLIKNRRNCKTLLWGDRNQGANVGQRCKRGINDISCLVNDTTMHSNQVQPTPSTATKPNVLCCYCRIIWSWSTGFNRSCLSPYPSNYHFFGKDPSTTARLCHNIFSLAHFLLSLYLLIAMLNVCKLTFYYSFCVDIPRISLSNSGSILF